MKKYLFVLFLFLVPLCLLAGKDVPWKEGKFRTASSGLQYRIVKAGKGDTICGTDRVTVDFVWYRRSDKSVIYNSKKDYPGGQEVTMNDPNIVKGFAIAIKMLKKGGKGYFKVPPSLGFGKKMKAGEDTLLYYITVKKIVHVPGVSPIINTSSDTIVFHIPDPADQYRGDSLFTLAKLVDVPSIVPCGMKLVMVAFRFQLTWFDNGVQRKDILVYVQCPENYGKDYFVKGQNYVLTAIPLSENLKEGKTVYNAYSGEKLDAYYGLRVVKK
ncbi:MAG TPA: FKBP-type peptidyl-prolyl cis-trans isomerase [Bacteroidia bacterium]|nr:FKBP-type peptidyl-prolyl cis-trans isomerase [Bacteroidia bacterium]